MRSLAVAAAFGSALFFCACAHPGGGRTARRDTLNVAMTGSPNTPNPILSTQQFEVQAEFLALDPLVGTDPEGRDVPILAARVPTLENGGIAKDGSRSRIVYGAVSFGRTVRPSPAATSRSRGARS